MMRRFFLVLICAGACITMLRAQVLPLAVGTEWVYRNADAGDTLRATITKSDQREVRCLQGRRRHPAWHDTQGRLYVRLPGGVMIGSLDEKGEVIPLLFLPGNLRPGVVPAPGNRACSGDYAFVGFAHVSTPAGEFDNCLIYDDRKVHRIYIKPGIGIVKEERYKKGTANGGVAGEREIETTMLLVGYTAKGADPR